MIHHPLNFSTWDKFENQALKKVIKSNFFTMGKKVESFERKFSEYLNRKYAVMVNSGSSANLVSVASFFFKKKNKLEYGDEVIVPAIGWSTTYSPLQQYGLKIKIVDVNLKDLNINFELLKKAVTSKTKMIVVVNILGVPCELDKIKKFCKTKNIYLFEDNCESLGSEIKKKKTGTFGDIATHSFFYSHHISTMEGGMVVTDDFETYSIIKSLRAHGWARDLPKSKKNLSIDPKKKNLYRFLLPGYNLRPGELHAAVGLEQIKKLKKLQNIRVKNWKLFSKLFKNNKTFHIQETKHLNSSFAFTLILKKSNKKLKKKIFKILSINNIEYRMITGGCITKHPYIKHFKYSIFKKLTIANKAHKDGFFVGNAGVDLSKQIYKLFKLIGNLEK